MLNTLSKAPWRVVNATLAKERTGSRTSKTRLVILYMDRCGSWQDLPLLPILGNSEQVLSTATFIHVLADHGPLFCYSDFPFSQTHYAKSVLLFCFLEGGGLLFFLTVCANYETLQDVLTQAYNSYVWYTSRYKSPHNKIQ